MITIIPPDVSTLTVIVINIGGWAFTIIYNVWRNSIVRYQHKAMWKKYADEHKIPTNGRD